MDFYLEQYFLVTKMLSICYVEHLLYNTAKLKTLTEGLDQYNKVISLDREIFRSLSKKRQNPLGNIFSSLCSLQMVFVSPL